MKKTLLVFHVAKDRSQTTTTTTNNDKNNSEKRIMN
jgi:hypothetical protein